MDHTVLTDAEQDLWTTYLNDHATGATGALERLEMMAEEYTDLPHHDDLQTLTGQITQERERVRRRVRRDVGVVVGRVRRVVGLLLGVARVAVHAGRAGRARGGAAARAAQ